MKKFLLFIAFAAANNVVTAQSCPNGNFEVWGAHNYNVLDSGWYDSNSQSISQNDTLTVWKVTGISGNAVHLQTSVIGLDTNQAYITNSLGDPMAGIGGFPFSQQPTAFTGYYKYNLPGSDSATLVVFFKKSGTIISTNKFMISNSTGSLATFTPFSFPISLSVVPDSVIIAASSSNVFGSGLQNGSWLELDQLAFTGTGITQSITDGSFDNWTPTAFEVPTGWKTTIGFISGISKSTDHFEGNYSAKLVSTPSGGGGGGPVSPAFLTTGNISKQSGPVGGLPYTQMIDTLTGYYTYVPVGADTAGLNITLSQAGSPMAGFGTFFLPATSWTYFEVPFSVTTAPDTMRIDIMSASRFATIPGSTLQIDHMQLKSQPLPPVDVATLQMGKNSITYYPNPVADQLHVKFGFHVTGYVNVLIYDIVGHKYVDSSFLSKKSGVTIPVDQLPTGNYFVEILGKDLAVRDKFFKK